MSKSDMIHLFYIKPLMIIGIIAFVWIGVELLLWIIESPDNE